jgi:outer membrane immunogenic protein
MYNRNVNQNKGNRMKKITSSIVATLAVSTFLVAGGDIAPVEPVVETPVVSADQWSGPYVGVQAGYVFSKSIATSYDGSYDPEDEGYSTTNNPEGGAIGILAGYNFLLSNNVLIGIEGEYNYANADDARVYYDGEWGTTITHEWDASLLARIGMVRGDTLFYVTGGYSTASVESNGWVSWREVPDIHSDKLDGFTGGVGIENKITENVNVRLQYRYTDYGDMKWMVNEENSDDYDRAKLMYKASLVTVGVIYKF